MAKDPKNFFPENSGDPSFVRIIAPEWSPDIAEKFEAVKPSKSGAVVGKFDVLIQPSDNRLSQQAEHASDEEVEILGIDFPVFEINDSASLARAQNVLRLISKIITLESSDKIKDLRVNAIRRYDEISIDISEYLYSLIGLRYNDVVSLKERVQRFLSSNFDLASSAGAEGLANVIAALIQEHRISETSAETSDSVEDIKIAEFSVLPPFQAYTKFVQWLNKENPIPKYGSSGQTGEKLNPIEHYDKYWRKFSTAGLLYRDTLSEYDEKLSPSVRNYCQYRPRELNPDDFLPPEPYVRYLKILKTSEPSTPEFSDAAIKVGERKKKERRIFGAEPA